MKHDFATLRHPKTGEPSVQYIYRDEGGIPVLIANRFDRREGGKYFLPYNIKRAEWKAPATRPIYNLDKIRAADPATPVILVEGEKCADALAGLGYLTTTTFGGSNASAKTDLSPLASRIVILWPDHDEAGRSYVEKVG